LSEPWWHDEDGTGKPTNASEQLTLNLTPDDEVLYAIHFAGWFIKHPDGPRYHDNTPINRQIMELRIWGARFE
jgi:hypothetical protein